MQQQTISLEEGWKLMRTAIDKLEDILNSSFSSAAHPFTNAEYMNVYTVCYRMCAQRTPHNWSEQLYQRHGTTIRDYLTHKVLPAVKDKHGEYLLTEVVKRWEHHKIMNKWLNRFFQYLNRYFVQHHNLPTLVEAGLSEFCTVLFTPIKVDLANAMLDLINKERDGDMVDRGTLRKCVEVFEAMGDGNLDVYRDDFQSLLLGSTKEYYARKAQAWIESDPTPVYAVKAEEALLQEADRVSNYLNASTEGPLLRVVEHELLATQQQNLLEKEGSGLRVLLRDKKQADLARIFRLFQRIPNGLVPVARILQDHIQEAGLAVVRERESLIARGVKENPSDPTFVDKLLQLHAEAKQSVTGEFSGNSLFQKALQDAFEVFVNKEVPAKMSNAEMICNYCDRLLRTGGAKLSEPQVEEALERVVQLFSFVRDKDVFGEVYRNLLAKRLLNQRSASGDAERSMISKLKLRCGAQYTGKMEGMLADLAVGSDHQRDFKKHVAALGADARPPMDFTVQVLTTGFWPTYKQVQVALPAEFTSCQSIFTSYYDSITSHRKLKWMYTLGTAAVKGHYAKTYDFQVTTLQAVTMLVFNHKTGDVPFTDLRAAVNVDEDIMKRLLHSLSCGKYHVLKKTPSGRTISTSDTFRFNDAFVCPLVKIRIPMASLDDSHNPKRVEEDRSIAIEAAVVRTMKARKTLQHQALVSEVISQLHQFKPDPKQIKKRIEHLLEREYLERDVEKANVYNYLA